MPGEKLKLKSKDWLLSNPVLSREAREMGKRK